MTIRLNTKIRIGNYPEKIVNGTSELSSIPAVGNGFSIISGDGNAYSGTSYLSRTGLYATNYGSDLIPIPNNDTYRVTGWARWPGTGNQPRFYLGFSPRSADGTSLILPATFYNGGADVYCHTTVDANAGSTVLTVDDATGFNITNAEAAFNADSSGAASDVPNFDYRQVNTGATSGTTLTLNQATVKFYPAGTTIRRHVDGANFMYCAAANALITTSWVRFTATVSGAGTRSSLSSTSWWPGTKTARLLVLSSSPSDGLTKTMWLDNLSVSSGNGPLYPGGIRL